MVVTDRFHCGMPGFSPHTAYNQTKKMSNHCNQNSFASQKLKLFSKAMKPKASFAHYIHVTIVPLTDNMPEFFPGVHLPTQWNQTKKLSNHYNYNPRTTKLLWGGYIGFTPSVRPSIRPASRVRSVAPTVLIGSISYLHILPHNFKRCVACKVSCKISKCEFLAIF